MADYFTHFSCLLPMSADDAEACVRQRLADLALDPDAAGGFVASVDRDALWIRDNDGHVDLDALVNFIIGCWRARGLSGLFVVEYAQTCSRPRAGAFGGGAIVIDLEAGEVVEEMGTGIWSEEVIARHGRIAPLISGWPVRASPI